MSDKSKIDDWDKFYEETDIKTMAWFNPDLDIDIKKAIKVYGKGNKSLLDIGTGPGTHAITLSKLGFLVTATDISAAAIKKARDLSAREGVSVSFLQDNILDSKLEKHFNFVVDIGCFHTLEESKRHIYVNTLKGLMYAGSYLFLKTFSIDETMEGGPYRFGFSDIRGYFRDGFFVEEIKKSTFRTINLGFNPKALFSVIKRTKD